MKFFGANWQTTVSGIGAAIFSLLTMLAALPYELGPIADIFPPDWKAKIVTGSLIAAFALKYWNALKQKDKNVTGGSTQQTLGGDVVEPGKQTMVDMTKEASPASERSAHPEAAHVHLPESPAPKAHFTPTAL